MQVPWTCHQKSVVDVCNIEDLHREEIAGKFYEKNRKIQIKQILELKK